MKNIEKIGIDWLKLSDFEIKYDKSIVKQEIAKGYIQDRIRIDENLFSLDNVVRVYSDNTITQYKYLRFNPNKILHGHNISNSGVEEIKKAIDKLKGILKKHGIEIDLTNAKIKEIEININLNKSFDDLKEVFSVMFINSPKSKKISNYEGSYKYKELYADRTIQSEWQSYSGIVYDKTAEINDSSLLNIPITRLEWRFTGAIYNYYTRVNSIDTKLESLLDNFHILESIFKNHCAKKLKVNAENNIKNHIKPNLEIQYLAFKRAAKLARENNRTSSRNVYRHLEDYWIFDYTFLEELIHKHDKAHWKREIERVRSKYICHDNLEKLNYLANYIFPTIHN